MPNNPENNPLKHSLGGILLEAKYNYYHNPMLPLDKAHFPALRQKTAAACSESAAAACSESAAACQELVSSPNSVAEFSFSNALRQESKKPIESF